jgi:hypothetical protein
MKNLHSIIPLIAERLYWYGTGRRCHDRHHSGYDYERGEIDSHTECTRNNEARNQNIALLACICSCPECNNEDTSHYYAAANPTDNAHWSPEDHLDPEDEEPYNLWNGGYLCLACMAGHCPTPPPITLED